MPEEQPQIEEGQQAPPPPDSTGTQKLAEALYSQLHTEEATVGEQPSEEQPPESEEQAGDTAAEPLPQPRLVTIGGEVYDYDFVESAVAEAERVGQVAEELEQELAEVSKTRQELQELEYLLKAIQGRLGDPDFYRGLQALLEGKPVAATATEQQEPRTPWDVPQEQSEVTQQQEQPAPPVLVEMLNQNIQQAVVPLYAAYARQAGEKFADRLEAEYNIKLSPEERVQIRNRAIDRGDFRSEHLFADPAENPLKAAFFEVVGPRLIERQRKEEQRQITPSLPEKGQGSTLPTEQLASSQSRRLAEQFLRSLKQGL